MGRFRRKRFQLAAKNGTANKSSDSSTFSSSSSSKSSYHATFASGDYKILNRYLRDYRDGAFKVLKGERIPKRTSAAHVFDQELPILNDQTLRQPYLSLPETFTSRQRKISHEICCDLGIYHASFDAAYTGNRFVAASIYHDGFDRITQDSSKGVCHQDGGTRKMIDMMYRIKPWIYQNACGGEDTTQATREGRKRIYKLVDQPGDALRDGIDFLDFETMGSDDLSQTVPPTFESPDWRLVDTHEKMKACVKEMEGERPTEIAFDLECYNKSKYAQVTCLLQLATSQGKEYVIDTLAPGVWESVNLLAPLFADPDIVKVGHSIGGLDVRSLHRDFGIFIVNAFDTYEASRCLGLPGHGLAKVCAHYGLPNCNVYEALKEEYQTTDWTRRPLTEPMIRYGRYDVHYLIHLRKLMMRDLAKSQLWEKDKRDVEAAQFRDSMAAMFRNFDEDEEIFLDAAESGVVPISDDLSSHEDAIDEESVHRTENGKKQSIFDASELRLSQGLMQAISRSQERCLDLWTSAPVPPLRDSEFQSLLLRCKSNGIDWTVSQLQLYEDLAKWREDVAMEKGCMAEFVCTLGFLASVAFARPTNLLGLKKITFELPGCLKEGCERWIDLLFAMNRKSRLKDGLNIFDEPYLTPSFADYDSNQFTSSPIWPTIAGGVVSFAAIAGIAVFLVSRNKHRYSS